MCLCGSANAGCAGLWMVIYFAVVPQFGYSPAYVAAREGYFAILRVLVEDGKADLTPAEVSCIPPWEPHLRASSIRGR